MRRPGASNLLCPKCSAATVVKDSRPAPDAVRRRRVCAKCDYTFTTYEIVLPDDLERIDVVQAINVARGIRNLHDRIRVMIDAFLVGGGG